MAMAPKGVEIFMDQNDRAQYLVDTYADTILRLSYAYLKNTNDAEDICQTVFVKLLASPRKRKFKSREHEKAWIMRTAANACKDLLKSSWRKRTCGLDSCAEQAAPAHADDFLLDAVGKLPPRYRAVIHLYYYEGYQANEIGRILSVPTATVHTRLARGRAKLKTLLGGTENYEKSI